MCVSNERKPIKGINLNAILKMFAGHRTRAWRLAKELFCNSVRDLDSGEGMALGIEVKGLIRDLLKQAVVRF